MGKGVTKSWGRFAFEVIHKWCGYLFMFVGIANIMAGIFLVDEKGYNAFTVISGVIVASCLEMSVIVFIIVVICGKKDDYAMSCLLGCLSIFVSDSDQGLK